MASEIKHQLGIVDGNENATGAFRDDWLIDLSRNPNARDIDLHAACFRRQMRRYRRIETVRLGNRLCFRNFRELDDSLAVGSLGCARLNWLPVNRVQRGNKKRGQQSFTYVRIRAGDKEGFFHERTACSGACSSSRIETSTSLKRASRSVVSFELREIRRREVPAGTLGGRIGRTPKPASFRSPEKRIARSFSPRKTGTICVSPRPISNPASRNCLRRNALNATRSLRSRSAEATMRIAARICAAM